VRARGGVVRRRELLERRLASQWIAVARGARPADVVAHFGAMQAQDYLGALWAVGMRLGDGAREAGVEAALADRSIVRTWPMRGTLHFVAAEDARWIVELLATRMVPRAGARFRALGIDEAQVKRARRILTKRLADGPMTRPAVYAALDRGGVATAGQRGIHVLWRLAHDTVLCFGPRQGKQQTFALFEQWLPDSKSKPGDESLAELAVRYFASHGPATVADFAWWSGLRRSEVQHAIALAGRRLEEVVVDGTSHWSEAGAPAPASVRGHADLLPAFDEFLVGYADRTAALDAEHAKHVNWGGGILNPAILVDGRIAGTWKRRIGRGGVHFAPEPFARLPAAKARAVAQAFERYAAFLGLEAHTA
jgi:hypothetical protein